MRTFFVLVIFSFFFCFNASSQDKIALTPFAEDLSIPVDIAFDKNDVMYVVEKRGKIIRIVDGVKNTFLDITSIVNSGANERGLLGMALDPNYINNGHFYVNYINSSGHTVIARFTRSFNDNTISNAASQKHIMLINQPYNNHNGGCLKFGSDGFLYIAMGDGGSGGDPGNRAQNTKERLGKMLRIDVSSDIGQYNIPANNPFVGSKDTLEEIWAIGLRNPWRFSFDKVTGDMWIADVGQNKQEEIDFEPAGSKGGLNYGWRCYEGDLLYDFGNCNNANGYVPPVFTYPTKATGDGCSITGGFVYRGKAIPYLNGQYVYGDFCTSKIWRLKKDDCGKVNNELIYSSLGSQEVSSFGEDNDGELYVAALGSGIIYKLMPKCQFQAEIDSIKGASCALANDGSVSFNITGASSFTYSLTGPSDSLTQLKAGQYQYTLKDSMGCTVSNCFSVGIDPIVICPLATIGEIFFCKNRESLFQSTACDSIGIDSFELYKDGNLIAKNSKLSFAISEEGLYDIKYRIGLCLHNSSLGFMAIADSVDEAPTVSYNGEKVNLTGPYQYYQMYKNDSLISQNTSGVFEIKPEDYGNYIFVGFTENGCKSNPSDVLIISSIDDEIVEESLLYPNPFDNVIMIKAPDVMYVTIYDSRGTEMTRESSPSDSINTAALPSGIYFIKVAQAKRQTWIKMVKS